MAHLQPSLFDAPVPFSGRGPAPRHAGYTGALAAVQTWAMKQSAYLQMLNHGGALTDQEAAALLKWPLASVNSTRNGINDLRTAQERPPLIVSDGFDVHPFTNARGNRCQTKRTRWRIAR
jgi:hypothetical protein